MSVILTQKYAHIIEKRGLKRLFYIVMHLFPLLKDIINSDKHRELFSFAVWEAAYFLKLFPKSAYVKFDDTEPLVLTKDMEIGELDFTAFRPFEIKRSKYDWKVLFIDKRGDIYATVANDDRVLYKSRVDEENAKRIFVFENIINSVFVTNRGAVLVCSCGELFRSGDGGMTFQKVLTLTNPSNRESYIFHANGFTQSDDGAVFAGEYGNVAKDGRWMNVANIYKSTDDGKSWQKSEFLKRKGVNKHVHMIKYSKNLKRLFLSDGDNLKKLWISEKEGDFDINAQWRLVNSFHIQMGGYTSMCEVGKDIILGTDYLGGTNFLVRTEDGKKFIKKLIPDPYRRSPVMNLQKLRFKENDTIWAILHNPISSKTRCLLICSTDAAASWRRVIEYDGTVHEIQLNSDTNTNARTLTFALTDKIKNEGVCYEIRLRERS